MKRILILLLFLGSSSMAAAQIREVKKMSYELGAGYSFAPNKNEFYKAKGELGGYFECRYNFANVPIDLGGHLGITGVRRKSDSASDYLDYRSFSVMAVGDYVFMRGRKVSPYVGFGLGVAFSNYDTGIFNYGTSTAFTCMPRVGIRFLKHLSLSMDYQLIQKNYSHANVRFGIYL